MIPRSRLLDIAARSEPLIARLKRDANEGSEIAPEPIERWRGKVAGTDEERWRSRLDLDGLDDASVRAKLGDVPPAEPPSWTGWLNEIGPHAVEVGADLDPARKDRCLPDKEVAFQEVCLPVVLAARARLEGATGAELLEEKALADIEEWLLKRVSQALAETLFVEFTAGRTSIGALLGGISQFMLDPASTERYDEFVRKVLGDGMSALWDRSPAAARLVATITENWMSACADFLRRLSDDSDVLRDELGCDGSVAALSAGVSDPHNHGRSALVVEFSSGSKAVYKPRGLAIEKAFFDLVHLLNERGATPDLRVLRVLPRPGYGWVEFADHVPCSSADEARRFFRRAGMLVALGYALNASDLHRENLIASGEHPVFIDSEMMLLADARFIDDVRPGHEAMRAAQEFIGHSVMTLGMLPGSAAVPGGGDVSGMGKVGSQRSLQPVERFVHVNTDAMTKRKEFVEGTETPNTARLGDEVLSALDHADDVERGFDEMYRLLLRVRDDILREGGWLDGILDARIRFLMRGTMTYALVAQKANGYGALQDGIARGLEIDVLSKPFTSRITDEAWWPLYFYEATSLEEGDIPLFDMAAGDRVIAYDGEPTSVSIGESAAEATRRRMAGLSEDDLATQSRLVSTTVRRRAPEPRRKPDPGRADDATLTATARRIAEMLEATSIRAEDGMVWAGYEATDESGAGRIATTGPDVYNGTLGPALFFAACSRVLGDGYADLARAATAPVLATAADFPFLISEQGVGLSAGTGGLVYALTHIGDLISDHDLSAKANAFRAATAAGIPGDVRIDVLSGVAGTALAYVRRWRATEDPEDLQVARLAGERLLDTAAEAGEGLSWRTLEGMPALTGMSHGAAGIAYSLARLAEATGDERFAVAARRAVAFENDLFDRAERNWPDLRNDEEGPGSVQWCHGATGIGLARIGSGGVLDGDLVERDVETALATTHAYGLGPHDHLCCGNAGRMELFVTAGVVLQRPELVQHARSLAGAMIDRAGDDLDLRLRGPSPTLGYSPSLFMGITGFGYECLRILDPGSVPNVLLFE